MDEQPTERMIELQRRLAEAEAQVEHLRALRAEAEENSSRLRLMLAQTPAILWSVDRDLRVTFSRGGGLEALGMRNDEAVGLPLAEMLGTDDPAYRPYGAHLEALRGESCSYSMSWRGRDYETRIEPYRTPEGEITGAIGITLDVTERQASLQALAASERQFRSLIENIQDIITVMDADGTIRFESAAVEHVLGYPPGERVGRSALDMVHPDDRPAVQAALARAAAAPGSRQSVSLRVRHRDGSWRELEVVGTNLLHDPAVSGIVFNSRDVTERNLLEAQLRQAQRMESVGKLAGGIAHDFNNLLTVIQGSAQLLSEDLPAGSEARADAQEIERAARRAAELTQQLLVFSRRNVLQPVLVDFNGVVREMERMLRGLILEDVQLVTRLADDLAAVRADPTQLHQVLVNLAVNARDAMPNGGVLTIATRNDVFPREARQRGEPAVRLSVADDGVGMSRELRERAFEPFFTTKPPGEGTGLGLSTVYGIVEESGGYVCLRSEPGEGTTVEVYLPAILAAPTAEVPAQPEPVPAEARPTTILLVEDEDAVRGVARKALERAGYRVLAVGNGAEALQVVEKRGPELDLVVSDVVMPGMSGPEMVQRVRQAYPALRVLYISGYTDEAVVRRGVAQGTAELLAKPFSPVELVQRVSTLLSD
jgi:two-component system, cell cycle sensor histidine kinase and response regulator CckA